MTTPLPSWIEKLKEFYLSGEAIQFLLHANVRDVFLHEGKLLNLQDYLYQAVLKPTREHVIFYDPSQGLAFPNDSKRKQFLKGINFQRTIAGESLLGDALPRHPETVLPLLETFMRIPEQRSALVIHFLETIVPAAEISFLSTDERSSLMTLQRWSADQGLLNSDTLILMLCENLADVNNRIVKNPQIVTLEVPLPDYSERLAFVHFARAQYPSVQLEMSDEQLAHLTAGLRRLQLDGLFRQAKRSNVILTFASITERKKAIIEQECFNLVEMVQTRHDLSVVGGMDKSKNVLRRVAGFMREGPRHRAPMGLLFVGPMGTGKTFVAEAFVGDSRLTCVKLKNFRDRWVGSTEANLEKIFTVVKAMGPVIIIVDEVDRAMSGGENDGDSGVSSRVYARMKAFMSDTSHRGHILWILMTNRPDKLDIDLTRAGRIDVKIPFFFPQTVAERIEILQALAKKNKLNLKLERIEETAAALKGYSGAEMEAIPLIADEMTADAQRDEIQDADFAAALEDFIPNRDETMLEYMELLAVFQCSSRRLLPDTYRELSNEAIQQRLREVESLL